MLVVDGGGDTTRALVGKIMKRLAQSRGLTGFVIDGAVRDADTFANDDFPCFARAVCSRGPFKNGPGEIGVPVTVGGLLVQPGDVALGDADGLIAVPARAATDVAAAARALADREAAVMSAIAEGRYDDTWIGLALSPIGDPEAGASA